LVMFNLSCKLQTWTNNCVYFTQRNKFGNVLIIINPVAEFVFHCFTLESDNWPSSRVRFIWVNFFQYFQIKKNIHFKSMTTINFKVRKLLRAKRFKLLLNFPTHLMYMTFNFLRYFVCEKDKEILCVRD
jgi:hypothetical protein